MAPHAMRPATRACADREWNWNLLVYRMLHQTSHTGQGYWLILACAPTRGRTATWMYQDNTLTQRSPGCQTSWRTGWHRCSNHPSDRPGLLLRALYYRNNEEAVTSWQCPEDEARLEKTRLMPAEQMRWTGSLFHHLNTECSGRCATGQSRTVRRGSAVAHPLLSPRQDLSA